jgi:Prion-inhibition and propagation
MAHLLDLAGFTGSLNIPTQLFSTGVIAYTTISNVRNMGRSIGREYWLFKVQESRYLFWGMCHKACSPGGLDFEQMPKLLQAALVNTLVQINSLLEDKNRLATRYGLEQVVDIQPADISLVRRESQRQQNMVSRLHRGSSLLRKMQWVVRDHGKFAELTHQLTTLIDALHELLPVPAGSWVDDAITAQTLADTLINTGEVNHVNHGGTVLRLPTPQFGDLAGLQQAITAISTASNLETVERSTRLLHPIASRFSIDVQGLTFLGPRVIKNSAPHLRTWARTNTLNSLSGEFRLIEWRGYDLGGEQKPKVDLQARLEALVEMLMGKPRSDSFRVFDCLGYFMDNTAPRFGLTFRLPSDYSQERDPQPMSLYDVLNDYPKDIPYLGDRFRLAYNLAETVHGLHSTSWLHKSICSRNILLFRKNPHAALPGIPHRPVSLETPYFTGFALSRPDNLATDSSLVVPMQEVAIYRHKDVQGFGGRAISRYRAIYDIYSLGMVLVEIGTWQTISNYCPRNPAADFAKEILRKVVPRLGVSMGENYMNVVKKCLEGSFERLAGFDQTEYDSMSYRENVRQGLLWEVVNVLRECRA